LIELYNFFKTLYCITFPIVNNKSKGCAEDELGDGEPKYAKLRPMRVAMHLRVWKDLRGF